MEKQAKRTREKANEGKNFNPRLKRMLQIYLVVAVVMFVYVVYSTIRHGAQPLYVGIGLLVGVGIGIIFSRIFKITWDESAGQVIYRMDIIGIVLLIIFIIFDLARGDIVASFITGSSVRPTSFALLAGCFYGRVLGSKYSIVSVLREQKILPRHKK